MLKKIILIITYLVATANFAAESQNAGPKLLILRFVNSSGDTNYDYLESSITESVTQYLRERYVFQQMVAAQRDEYIRDNYYRDQDFHTETVSMKLGLELNQDAVISGHFWVKGNEIVTEVRISDIRNRRPVSEFRMKGPAGSNLFISIEKIAVRIASESATILPNKEEYARRGTASYAAGPFFSRVSLGARVGGQYFFGGYNDYLKADQPSFGLNMRTFMRPFRQRFGLQFDATVMNHSLNEKRQTFLNDVGVQLRSINFILGGGIVFEIPISQKWSAMPVLGGGFLLQSTTLSGTANQSLLNGMPFAQVGFDMVYGVNRHIEFAFGPRFYAQFEQGTRSYIANFNTGVNFRF